jgi:hypothetical protein
VLNRKRDRNFNKKLSLAKTLNVIRDWALWTLRGSNLVINRIRRKRSKTGATLKRLTKDVEAKRRRVAGTADRREGAVELQELSVPQPSI